jgi:hypothetical protein
MKIQLEVEYADSTKVEVVCSAPDIVKFEEKFDIAITKAAIEMKLTHLLFLAYASVSRNKQTDLTFEKWTETIEGIGAADSPKSKG